MDWLIVNVGGPLLVLTIAAVAAALVAAIGLRHRIAAAWLRWPWPRIDRVPRTEGETRRLLAKRPPGWEWLHFAGELRRRLAMDEEKYRDNEARFARPSDLVLPDDGFGDRMSEEVDRILLVVDNWEELMNGPSYERAVGRRGEAGDPERIEHLADRLTATYVLTMDWSARLRGARVAEPYRRLVKILARFPDQPIAQYRDFVAEAVRQVDRVPALLRDKERGPVEITLELVLSIAPDVMAEYEAEFAMVGG